MPDFEFDVGIDTAELDRNLGFIQQNFGLFGQLVSGAVNTFRDLDEAATQAGQSVRDFAGISRGAEDSYRNFVRTFSQSTATLQGAVLERLGPTLNFITENINEVTNAINRRANELAARREGRLEQFQTGRPGGFFGRAVRIVSEDAQRRENEIEDRQILASARNELNRLDQQRSELRRGAFEGVEDIQTRALRRRQREGRREITQRRIDAINQREFAATQALQGDVFEESQIISPAQATIAAGIQRQIAAQQFRIRQDAAARQRELRVGFEGERRDVQKAARADDAMIQLQRDVRQFLEPIEEDLREIAKQRAEQLRIVEEVEGD